MPAYTAEAAAANPNGISTFLDNGLSKFFINVKPNFSIGPSSLPRNSRDCIILDSFVLIILH